MNRVPICKDCKWFVDLEQDKCKSPMHYDVMDGGTFEISCSTARTSDYSKSIKCGSILCGLGGEHFEPQVPAKAKREPKEPQAAKGFSETNRY